MVLDELFKKGYVTNPDGTYNVPVSAVCPSFVDGGKEEKMKALLAAIILSAMIGAFIGAIVVDKIRRILALKRARTIVETLRRERVSSAKRASFLAEFDRLKNSVGPDWKEYKLFPARPHDGVVPVPLRNRRG